MVVNGRPLKRAKSRVAATSPLDLIPHNQPIDLDAIADLRDARTSSDLIPLDLIVTRGVSDLDAFSPGSIDLSRSRSVLDLDAIAAEGDLTRSFRESVKAILSRYGRLMTSDVMAWQMMIRARGIEVELLIVEEDVIRSRSVYCDQCRVVGWSGHPVCAKRYHFIIRNEIRASQTTCLRNCCVHCGTLLLSNSSRCMTCKLEGRVVVNRQEDNGKQLDDVSHLLHAVVHSNGYGHLLRVNGHQGGSKYLTGRQIMNFWDHLCKLLHVRKVTVMDISKKHNMEYRLLHSVTAGHPWYGEWGYEFGAGSYGVDSLSYHRAVASLSSTPLSLFTAQNRSPRTQLSDVISLYKSLSHNKLSTVRDLFKFITTLLHESNTPIKMNNNNNNNNNNIIIMNGGGEDEVESVQKGMIKVLRAVGKEKWVGWRALKGATSKAAESTDVLDRSLKGLAGRTTEDGFVVAARCNSQTNTLEYRLEAAMNQQSILDCTAFSKPSTGQLLRDLTFLYNSLLNLSTMQNPKPESPSLKSAQIILDCKQFIKCYNDPFNNNPLPLNPFMLHVWCVVELTDCPNDFTNPPPELLIISASATISDLKLHASRTFQEIYPLFQGFNAENVITNTNTSESALVKHVINPNEIIRVRGRCLGQDMSKLGLYKMERGLENWEVDCECGARDDDGERMMACDNCSVWQHTRCNGVKDCDEVPCVFVCVKCLTKSRRSDKVKGDDVDKGVCVNSKVGRDMMMNMTNGCI